MEEENDFRAWVAHLGYNKRQVTMAADTLGLGEVVASRLNRGERELSRTERLAMTAVAIGLPEWSPQTMAEVDAYRHLIEALRSVAPVVPAAAEETTGHRIPAERSSQR